MDEFIVGKLEESVNDLNKILDQAYGTLSEEDFIEFGEQMLEEVDRLSKKIREINELA
jgi:predicted transcriptional regulator